jgi:acetaldehyde dehydrogenase / alcohol dehydrogenase
MTVPNPFELLSADDRAIVGDYLEPVSFAADTRLFDAGDEGEGCWLIDDGLVRLDLPFDEVDSDATLGYLEPGQLLGELALIDGSSRSVHATAESDVAARWLSRAALDRLTVEHPAAAAAVLELLAADVVGKLRSTTERLGEHLSIDGRDLEVERMVAAATEAQIAFESWDEERVDALLRELAKELAAQAQPLAEISVEVTRIGNAEDKTLKNTVAALGVLALLDGVPANGVLGPASDVGVTEIAAPAGPIFGIIPMTNPIATAIFKTLIALKGRNALILSFHRICLPLAEAFLEVVDPILERHGAPADILQCVRARSSRQRTARFMSHPGVRLILATGGPGMVRAAHRSGTPAIGVGSGNAPTWVAADADVRAAAEAIVLSKSFDNGLICGAEHNLVVDASIAAGFTAALEAAGAAVLSPEEAERFLSAAVTEDGRGFQPMLIGQSAATVAGALAIERDHPIRVIVLPGEPDLGHPITSEKMSPLLSLFVVDGDEAAVDLSLALIRKMGAGHTAIIHTADEERAARFAHAMPASRLLVNSPGSHGVCGITTGLPMTFTLGCGTFGGNSTTDNVGWRNLVNIKRMATHQA